MALRGASQQSNATLLVQVKIEEDPQDLPNGAYAQQVALSKLDVFLPPRSTIQDVLDQARAVAIDAAVKSADAMKAMVGQSPGVGMEVKYDVEFTSVKFKGGKVDPSDMAQDGTYEVAMTQRTLFKPMVTDCFSLCCPFFKMFSSSHVNNKLDRELVDVNKLQAQGI